MLKTSFFPKLKRVAKKYRRVDTQSSSSDGKKQAIIKKAIRLGLEVVKQQKPRKKSLTSSLELPKELPSVEEALKILAGALTAAAQPGLDKVAVSFSERDPLRRKNIGGIVFGR